VVCFIGLEPTRESGNIRILPLAIGAVAVYAGALDDLAIAKRSEFLENQEDAKINGRAFTPESRQALVQTRNRWILGKCKTALRWVHAEVLQLGVRHELHQNPYHD